MAGGRYREPRTAVAGVPAILPPPRRQRANRIGQPRFAFAGLAIRRGQNKAARHAGRHRAASACQALPRLAALPTADAAHRHARFGARGAAARMDGGAGAGLCRRSGGHLARRPRPPLFQTHVRQRTAVLVARIEQPRPPALHHQRADPNAHAQRRRQPEPRIQRHVCRHSARAIRMV